MTEEVRMARGAALATAAVAPVALGIAWWAAGPKGLLGAAFGLALAVAFFSATLLAVGAAGRVQPELMLPAAVITSLLAMSYRPGSLSLEGMLAPANGPGMALLAGGLFLVLLA